MIVGDDLPWLIHHRPIIIIIINIYTVYNCKKKCLFHIQGVTKKKPDYINHTLGTMPISKPLIHFETQLLSSIVLQFL